MTQTPASPSAGMEKMTATEAAVASFFAIAQEDLEASMVLYDKKLYRPAILLLQQAVEKAVKSLALQIGVIEMDDLKQIRHKPQDVYTGLIIEISNGLTNIMKDAEQQKEIQSALAPIGEDVDQLFHNFRNLKNKALSTAARYNKCHLSDDEVYDLLARIDEMNQEFFDWEQFIQHYLGEKEFKGHLLKGTIAVKIILFFLPMNPEEKNNLNSQIDEIVQLLPPIGTFVESISILITSLMASAFPLYYLSLLTAPHAMVARYPNATEENIDPNEFYIEETPIIANLPDIYDFTKQSFDQIERFYSHLTYLPEIQKEAFPRKEKAPQLMKKNNPSIQGGNSS